MVKKERDFLEKLKLVLSIPSFGVAIIILSLAVFSIILSKSLFDKGNAFWFSVFSNIFAGLITGLAVSVLSGTKTVYTTYLQEKCKWLQQTSEMILEFESHKFKLVSSASLSEEELFEMAYDAASKANEVHARISHSTLEKINWFDAKKFFVKHFDYDSEKESDYFNALHDFFYDYGGSNDPRTAIKEKLREVSHKLISLNKKIVREVQMLDIRIANMQKSII